MDQKLYDAADRLRIGYVRAEAAAKAKREAEEAAKKETQWDRIMAIQVRVKHATATRGMPG